MRNIRFRYRESIFLVIAAAVFCTGCQPSQQSTIDAEFPAIDSLIRHEIEMDHIPGGIIQVKREDHILHRRAYGFAQKYSYGPTLLEHPEKMTLDHLFDLASLTKVCATTFGIMILIDEGQISLDDPIHKYFPEFNTGRKSKITVRNLLSHTAGLYQWQPLYYHASNKEERFKAIVDLPLKFSVGAERHYSDLGFMLLGDIIEEVSGQSLDRFLERRFFKRLQLDHTAFNPLNKQLSPIAATSHGNPFEKHMVYADTFGYIAEVDPKTWDNWRKYTLKGEVNDGNAWYANNGVAGHAGLFSSIDDLQTMVDLLLNGGSYRNDQLISAHVIDTFLTKDKFGNGLGWAMDPPIISSQGAPPGTFGHTGFTGTSIVVVPELDLSIILLTNRQNVGLQETEYYYDLSSLRQKILHTVLESIK